MTEHQRRNPSPHGANANAPGEAQDFYRQNPQDPTSSPTAPHRFTVRPSQVASDLAWTDATVSSSSYPQPPQPINDAVSSAMHTADSTMSPELIQLITQKVYQGVLQQLQINQPSTTSAPPVQPPSVISIDQPDTHSVASSSPRIERAQVYTPPTPQRENRYSFTSEGFPVMPAAGQDNVTRHDRDTSPFSRRISESNVVNGAQLKMHKPDPIRRISSDADATVLEKAWERLFDEQGEATDRLSQFFRGIAMHLINEYEPRNSLIVTLDKMQKFYDQTRLSERMEIYPWEQVFDDATSSISRLFRDPEMRVEHHLVQTNPESRPEVPGLTPHGFATWMTILLKAHPDHEFERLAIISKNMAIDNPDNKGERFPKELSRRQFPARGDDGLCNKLVELIGLHCKVQVPSRTNSVVDVEQKHIPSSPRKIPPKPTVEDATDDRDSHGQSSKQDISSQYSPTSKSSPKDRDRNLQADSSNAQSEMTFEEDGSDLPTPQPRPIERERKPYIAQPGQGKSYDLSSGDEAAEIAAAVAGGADLRCTKSVSTYPRPRVPPPIAIHQRGDVNNPTQAGSLDLSRIQTVPNVPESSQRHRNRGNSSLDTEIQPARRNRANSTYAHDNGQRYPPKRTSSFSKGQDHGRPSVYDSYTAQGSGNNYPQGQYAQSGRHDNRNYNYGPREPRYREGSRDRDLEREARTSRAWPQNTANTDAYTSNSPDEYFRNNGPLPVNGGAGGSYQYPPTSYRDRDRERDGR